MYNYYSSGFIGCQAPDVVTFIHFWAWQHNKKYINVAKKFAPWGIFFRLKKMPAR